MSEEHATSYVKKVRSRLVIIVGNLRIFKGTTLILTFIIFWNVVIEDMTPPLRIVWDPL